MKIGLSHSLALGLALVLSAFAMTGPSGKAYAVNANHSGTICKNYNAAEATYIDYVPSGTRNISVAPVYVICPIVQSPTSTNDQVTVYVDGFAAVGATITCTLSSYDYNGTFLASQSFPAPATGTFDQSLTVPDSYWGNASVLCLLPGDGAGQIWDIDVVQ